MNALDALGIVEKSKEYQDFLKEEKNAYLANIFVFIDSNNPPKEWNVSYYDKKTKLITSFLTKEGNIERQKASEVLTNNQEIPLLDPKKVKISSDQALVLASKHQLQHYIHERPVRIILILQEHQEKTIYNITYLTQSFKTLNMKIDAKTGKIISHDVAVLFDIENLKK